MILGRFGSGSPTVIDFKGSHFEREIVLWGVRWYELAPENWTGS
jgi:hypothetical protein